MIHVSGLQFYEIKKIENVMNLERNTTKMKKILVNNFNCALCVIIITLGFFCPYWGLSIIFFVMGVVGFVYQTVDAIDKL